MLALSETIEQLSRFSRSIFIQIIYFLLWIYTCVADHSFEGLFPGIEHCYVSLGGISVDFASLDFLPTVHL